MQSLLQYRRLRQHLDQQIKEHGLEATANAQSDLTKEPVTEQSNANAHADSVLTIQATNQSLTNIASNVSDEIKPSSPPHEGADEEKGQERLLIVNFQTPHDPLNPQTWTKTRKWIYTFLIGSIGFFVSGASAFDIEITSQAAEYFGVSEEVALLSTSLYMIALGLGSLVSAPFSEKVGRNPIYIVCEYVQLSG